MCVMDFGSVDPKSLGRVEFLSGRKNWKLSVLLLLEFLSFWLADIRNNLIEQILRLCQIIAALYNLRNLSTIHLTIWVIISLMDLLSAH